MKTQFHSTDGEVFSRNFEQALPIQKGNYVEQTLRYHDGRKESVVYKVVDVFLATEEWPEHEPDVALVTPRYDTITQNVVVKRDRLHRCPGEPAVATGPSSFRD